MWSKKDLQNRIYNELDVNKNTFCSWSDDMTELCCLRLTEEDDIIGGIDDNSNPIVVEIDESVFCRRKYNRGRFREHQWVFTGIERMTNRMFLISVPNRNQEPLLRIIYQK